MSAPAALDTRTDIDAYETICDMGREAADSLDQGRWILGELASQIEARYGQHTIADFAVQCDVEKKRVYEYAQVWRWTEELSVGADYRAANLKLRYSHYRCAMRLTDPVEARTFLDECSTERYTVEQARLKLLDRLGKPAPARKLLDIAYRWAELPYEHRLAIGLHAYPSDALVRLVISEVAA